MKNWLRRWGLVTIIIAASCAVIIFNLRADRPTPHEVYPRTNYSQIEDGLYLGGMLSEPPPGTRVVLNVCEAQDPYNVEVHRWEPIPDAGPAPTLDWLRQQVEFIDSHRLMGMPVYVHCRAGVNRGPTMVAAYLMYRDGCSRDEALATLRAKRPRVNPYHVYLQLLQDWEDSLRKSPKS